VTSAVEGDVCTLTLAGAWPHENLWPLRRAFTLAATSARRLRLVLREVSHGDSAFVGLLMLAPRAFALGREVVKATPSMVRTLRRHGADELIARARGPHA